MCHSKTTLFRYPRISSSIYGQWSQNAPPHYDSIINTMSSSKVLKITHMSISQSWAKIHRRTHVGSLHSIRFCNCARILKQHRNQCSTESSLLLSAIYLKYIIIKIYLNSGIEWVYFTFVRTYQNTSFFFSCFCFAILYSWNLKSYGVPNINTTECSDRKLVLSEQADLSDYRFLRCEYWPVCEIPFM